MGNLATTLKRKALKSLRKRGVAGSLLYAAGYPLKIVSRHVGRPSPESSVAPGDAFDLEFGVDTKGRIPLEKLNITSPNWVYGTEYHASSPALFHQIMSSVSLAQNPTFIDFGSGKGRALLLASHYPFRKVIGVEFSEELHQIALRNIEAYRDNGQRCSDIQPVCCDATHFPFPGGPLVLYSFNPFEGEVMAIVLANLLRALDEKPRQVTWVYLHPVHRRLLDEAPQLELLVSNDDYAVYTNQAWIEAAERHP